MDRFLGIFFVMLNSSFEFVNVALALVANLKNCEGQ